MTSIPPNDDLVAIDRRHMLHPFTNLKEFSEGAGILPRMLETGQGISVLLSNGRQYIDAFAGLYCVNVGYGRREIAEAIAAQAHKLAYYHAYAGHSNEPAVRLAERVIAMAPLGMRTIYYGLSGSDANETQAKIVWYYNNVLGRQKKKIIISRQRGYHGATVLAGSLTGLPVFHQAFDLPLGPVRHISTPHWWREAEPGESEESFSERCAAELESLILELGPDSVAAFIGEPVLGTGGIIPPPRGYWAAIQQVLRRYDVLLIADEVVCGFGRLGTNFGSHLYDIQPDLITVAKGLTSAYLPLSGAIVGEKVWQVLCQGADEFGPFGHGYTYSAHPVCAAAGLANLDIIEREGIVTHAARVGAIFQQRLRDRFHDHPIVGEVRGVGLLAAIEFSPRPASRARFAPELKVGARIAAACLEEGLIARAMPHGDILGYAPPLVLTETQVDEIVDLTERAVTRVLDQLQREGALGERSVAAG